MNDKTGIFTFSHEVSKQQSDVEIARKVEWANDHCQRRAYAAITDGVSPGRMFMAACTESVVDYDRDPDVIVVRQKALVALLDWRDAQVGDCVVWDDLDERQMVKLGEVWRFVPHGQFPAVPSTQTYLRVYQRVD